MADIVAHMAHASGQSDETSPRFMASRSPPDTGLALIPCSNMVSRWPTCGELSPWHSSLPSFPTEGPNLKSARLGLTILSFAPSITDMGQVAATFPNLAFTSQKLIWILPYSDHSGGGMTFVNTSVFELSRWRGGRYRVVGRSIVARVRFGSQGGYCDPSKEADAG